MQKSETVILGAGITGLSAGYASGAPVYEARKDAGGICSSYYMRRGAKERLTHTPEDHEAYRFEIGGGHWIFGGDSSIQELIQRLAACNSHGRRSGIFFHERKLLVPYPLQNHVSHLSDMERASVAEEMLKKESDKREVGTMSEWLEESFGKTLCETFFHPFHDLYTAGLYTKIAPQDSYKTPRNSSQKANVGYNTSFLYPERGLDALVRELADACDVRYGKRVESIDTKKHEVIFSDSSNSSIRYDNIISTLPLHETLRIAQVNVDERPDPHTSVLVINIGAVSGEFCPKEHWVYIPHSRAGFHRVGFYSNVDASFLPLSSRGDRVGIYVEKAYVGGACPDAEEIEKISCSVVEELTQWGWIKETEVVDATWKDVAYTWSYPDSHWREKAIAALEAKNIYPVGRYARWKFQGIADSIKDGLSAGERWCVRR